MPDCFEYKGYRSGDCHRQILVEGGYPLLGEVENQGSKNGILPVLAASVLIPEEIILTHVPMIQDVMVSLDILAELGVSYTYLAGTLEIHSRDLSQTEVREHLSSCMRSSVLFLGSLLGACGEASVSYPGGCTIGKRPVDLHLEVLRRLGADIWEKDGRILASAHTLTGCCLKLPFSSVGATEQAILAAVSAEGTTVISGAAREPEVGILCEFLRACGARIFGEEKGEIVIEPSPLHGCIYDLPGDRIAAGTWLAAAAASHGELLIHRVVPEQMESSISVFCSMGYPVEKGKDWIYIGKRKHSGKGIPLLETGPYPGFPTDMQSIVLPLLAVAEGDSRVRENIFENRLKMAGELNRMGAEIRVKERDAEIHGVPQLKGTIVRAGDLRSGAGLVIAALGAEGKSTVEGWEYVERGYEGWEKKLRALGARINFS
ncbi:MAG: UDP-N-acetylglucosamine 1-carboxyvinyltransferase [Clostridiales bacterium]|nr:UDP-N-acetylglucosamine 1-carboxyvinyltransferase [Clostridiales bacterium]